MNIAQPSDTSNLGRVRRQAIALDLNTTTDVAIPVPFAKWRLDKVLFHDVSTSLALSLAVVGLYTSTGGGGTNLVTSVVTSLVNSTDCINQTLAAQTAYRTGANVYLRVTTTHGQAATVNVTLFFDDLS